MDTRGCSCKHWLDSYAKLPILMMTSNYNEKTIEGDLFAAMVTAGAISKANADDPKKSSLIRCARTDKGVHAAGNVISLKLIIEDDDIVEKINKHLSPQIRVFGIVRTNGSFSAYQFCDSRIYEYLIPTHCFLPPHPESFLGKQIVALAEEAGDREGFRERQSEVSTFWEDTEDKYIRPILEQMDPALRSLVMQAPYNPETKSTQQESSETNEGSNGKSHITLESGVNPKDNAAELAKMASIQQQDPPSVYPNDPEPGKNTNPTSSDTNEPTPFEAAIKSLRAAYLAAKHAYRIPPARLTRIRTALSHYLGTHNYHNYTISKPFRDASANRVIRTFTLAPTPLLINGTEWLSLKVHGQSFMMHQIRKMVSMAALVVRCGCNPVIMDSSFGPEKISIPKAPGLGLLLERPVFEAYNAKLERFGRDRIDFSIHENVMEEFKQREIYERIWREEEREHVFHGFFAAIDNLRSAQMLWVSSLGFEATRRAVGSEVEAVEEEGKKGVEDLSSDDDDDDDDGGAGDGDEG